MGAESRSGEEALPRAANRPYGDDVGLAAGLQAREEDALTEAIARYGACAFGVASRICRDPQLAEEAAQEAFLNLWRRPQVFDRSRGSLKTLVVSIARNKAIDLIRREESARRVQDALKAGLQHAGESSPWGDVDLRAQVEWALSALTPLQRDAISLAYFGGRTYREVAQELQIPEGTAKTRIRDGLARLRQLLQEPRVA